MVEKISIQKVEDLFKKKEEPQPEIMLAEDEPQLAQAPETEKEQIGSENIKMLGAYLNPTRNPNSKHLVRLSGFL